MASLTEFIVITPIGINPLEMNLLAVTMKYLFHSAVRIATQVQSTHLHESDVLRPLRIAALRAHQPRSQMRR